jgi:predicted O-linked N-acetylglucosamine transferase (SPINDLY family)
VQVNYLGYPGTMGAEYLDYILGDRHVIPPEHSASYAEKVVWLPHCYQVNDSKRKIAERTPTRAELGLPENGFVFCCFNNNYKIAPRVFDLWMRLLDRVQGSVLWLLEDNEAAKRNLRRAARQRGVAPERLVFAPRVTMEVHLARQRRADLFLDTLPYNAHVTASDALWAGLPLLTRQGGAFAGRVATSLLNAVGMEELVTTTWDDYEQLALNLATDAERLAGIKARLALNRTTHPLFDTDRFRRHIEAAYVVMWERAERRQPPASFQCPQQDYL